MAGKFDPITLEILWRRLISIVDEADASVARTAFSSLLRDAHDYTCIFTDATGREVVQGTLATPGQIGAMALGVKKIVSAMPLYSHRPGDVYITNDPWLLAGHLNDVCVLSPIHHRDRVIGFTACVFHHADIGGRVASDNHDVFEEGLFIPLLKLHDEGRPNEHVLDMIRWNVRTPEAVIGDIRSQVAANHVCASKMVEMMEDAGLETIDDLAGEIIDRTEKSMRHGIDKVPDGLYPYEGVIEGPGGRDDITIKIAVEVRGSDIGVDFDGTGPQVNWGGNVVFNFTYAYVAFAMKSIFNPDLPNNEGCVRPVSMKAPEGSVVNCTFPAAVAARLQVGHFMTEMVYRALAPAIPDLILADSGRREIPCRARPRRRARRERPPGRAHKLALSGQRRQRARRDLRERLSPDRGAARDHHGFGRPGQIPGRREPQDRVQGPRRGGGSGRARGHRHAGRQVQVRGPGPLRRGGGKPVAVHHQRRAPGSGRAQLCRAGRRRRFSQPGRRRIRRSLRARSRPRGERRGLRLREPGEGQGGLRRGHQSQDHAP
jgi:hypothetical protein